MSEFLTLKPSDPDRQLSPNFNSREFRCACCKNLTIDLDLILCLEKVRAEVGRVLIINSAYRCPTHNQEVGGVVNSDHVRGTAADVQTPMGFSTRLFASVVWDTRKGTGVKRLGVYDGYQGKHGFCHIGSSRRLVGSNKWGDSF